MNIAVYCGSSIGNQDHYRDAAEEIGALIGDAGDTLVYGGGKTGLMGVVSESARAHGGNVIGVMPRFMVEREIVQTCCTELILTDTMAQRKTKMIQLADAYVALPGGPGTLEEISEVISLARLGRHHHPCVLLNIDGYYDPLKEQFDRMEAVGFLNPDDRKKIPFADTVGEAFAILKAEA
jgi:uncharacterized protein (TIGR00730 family)